jgi:hypothetical protein
MEDNIEFRDSLSAAVVPGQERHHAEGGQVHGRYLVECFDADGNLKWADHIDNVVTTVGRNHMLDTEFAGATYSVTGPYMGLISSTSYSAVAAADTMASHAGWLEAGGTNAPTYSGTRKTVAFSAASGGSKASSSAASFGITGTGTVSYTATLS